MMMEYGCFHGHLLSYYYCRCWWVAARGRRCRRGRECVSLSALFFGRELVNFVSLTQRPGGTMNRLDKLYGLEVALTTCRSNNQLSI